MKQDSNDKRLDQVTEEFDEKLDSSNKNKTAKEMDHIFNQFDEETKEESQASRPSIANDTPSRQPMPPKDEEVPFDFNRFLEQMRYRSSIPVNRYFKSFIQSFDRRPWTVNEQIKIIQDFLDFIYVKMRECDTWREASEQEFGNAQEGMEKLVMNRLYHATFCPLTTDDKERDEILYQKISIFRWIHEKHLDIRETEHNESFLSFAASEILKINNYKAPRDKLICILNCCKVIFGLIKHVEGDAGADRFLPILIYVVIKANPPRLVSNVQYIYRFRNPEQLQAEAGYYLTNLMGAISFIETMEAKSLSISKEEFDSNIERTMNELKQERPSITLDKQQVSYENALHPTRSKLPQQPLLLDPTKAAALLERGSQFAQKTMQRPLTFVGKIFQGLSDTSSASSSRAESPV
ncbi:Vacuolar protein sorting-associated protein 9a, partial [Choanephora cucurbitarum]